MVKILFWHLLQPALYFYVFHSAFSTLSLAQQWLGRIVLFREALYLSAVLACAIANPAFLLVDVGASVNDDEAKDFKGGYVFLAMYVIAPERYVGNALLAEGGLAVQNKCVKDVMLEILPQLLDLCALGALGAGVGAGLPPALAVGYSVTSLGALVYILVHVAKGRRKMKDTEKEKEKKQGKAFLAVGLGYAVCCVLAFCLPLAATL